MRRAKSIILVILCLLILWTSNIVAESNIIKNNKIVFKNVNIIPMNEEVILRNYSIIIKDGVIHEITRKDNINLDKEAHVIDATNKYLMPGLADMHVHIFSQSDLKLFLANGITTVRNMAGNKKYLMYKTKINENEMLGPKIYTTTPLLDGDPPVHSHAHVLYDSKSAKDAVRRYKNEGYDFIKIYEKLNKEIYDAIIDEAKTQNIEVVGHVPDKVGIKNVISSNQVSIEHLDNYHNWFIIKDEILDMIVESKVWSCPTIVLQETYKNKDKKIEGIEYISPTTKINWQSDKRFKYQNSQKYFSRKLRAKKKATKNLFNKGGRLLLGTDCNNPYIIPGFSIHRELELLVESGLSPYEALKTGTYNAAEFFGNLDTEGTIEVGKKTDIILLNKNPLKNIKNTKCIEGVLTNGKWLNKSYIQHMLEEIPQEWK